MFRWYANFSTETHVYVIFEGKGFRYSKGDGKAGQKWKPMPSPLAFPRARSIGGSDDYKKGE